MSPIIANCGVFAFTYPPLASLGILILEILPTLTPGIKLITPIAPFIKPIALFIVFSIRDKTPLIPDLTEFEIALPILVPQIRKCIFYRIPNFRKK